MVAIAKGLPVGIETASAATSKTAVNAPIFAAFVEAARVVGSSAGSDRGRAAADQPIDAETAAGRMGKDLPESSPDATKPGLAEVGTPLPGAIPSDVDGSGVAIKQEVAAYRLTFSERVGSAQISPAEAAGRGANFDRVYGVAGAFGMGSAGKVSGAASTPFARKTDGVENVMSETVDAGAKLQSKVDTPQATADVSAHSLESSASTMPIPHGEAEDSSFNANDSLRISPASSVLSTSSLSMIPPDSGDAVLMQSPSLKGSVREASFVGAPVAGGNRVVANAEKHGDEAKRSYESFGAPVEAIAFSSSVSAQSFQPVSGMSVDASAGKTTELSSISPSWDGAATGVIRSLSGTDVVSAPSKSAAAAFEVRPTSAGNAGIQAIASGVRGDPEAVPSSLKPQQNGAIKATVDEILTDGASVPLSIASGVGSSTDARQTSWMGFAGTASSHRLHADSRDLSFANDAEPAALRMQSQPVQTGAASDPTFSGIQTIHTEGGPTISTGTSAETEVEEGRGVAEVSTVAVQTVHAPPRTKTDGIGSDRKAIPADQGKGSRSETDTTKAALNSVVSFVDRGETRADVPTQRGTEASLSQGTQLAAADGIVATSTRGHEASASVLSGMEAVRSSTVPMAAVSVAPPDDGLPGAFAALGHGGGSPGAGLAGSDAALAPAHTTLQVSPTVLEVGVPGGTHGWLKVRAEMGEDGAIQASVAASSHGGQEMLRRELPAMHAFLASEHVPVSLQVVSAGAAGSASADAGGMFRGDASGMNQGQGSGRGDAGAMPSGGEQSGGRPEIEAEGTAAPIDTGGKQEPGAVADIAWTRPTSYGGRPTQSGGGWLHVIA